MVPVAELSWYESGRGSSICGGWSGLGLGFGFGAERAASDALREPEPSLWAKL